MARVVAKLLLCVHATIPNKTHNTHTVHFCVQLPYGMGSKIFCAGSHTFVEPVQLLLS